MFAFASGIMAFERRGGEAFTAFRTNGSNQSEMGAEMICRTVSISQSTLLVKVTHS